MTISHVHQKVILDIVARKEGWNKGGFMNALRDLSDGLGGAIRATNSARLFAGVHLPICGGLRCETAACSSSWARLKSIITCPRPNWISSPNFTTFSTSTACGLRFGALTARGTLPKYWMNHIGAKGGLGAWQQ